MKRYINIILISGLSLVFSTSCLKEYLDKAPEQGLSDSEVFGKYENFRLFFDAVYKGQALSGGTWKPYNIENAFPLNLDMWGNFYTWESLTDASDQGRLTDAQTFKSGICSPFISDYTYDNRPILGSMFHVIRVCNIALQNIHYLEENKVKAVEINDLIGQAHFIRAFCHFELFRLWGPMPYLVNVIGSDVDQWDIPRLSKHETLIRVALDMDSAAYFFDLAGRTRRDAGPGQPGHLNDPLQSRPNGVAAKAYKSRALLYAASPLNNELGVTDWQNAAVAAWEALQLALAKSYELLPPATMKSNYVGNYSNEQLWSWAAGYINWNSSKLRSLFNGVFGANQNWSAVCPTQNFVDRYETSWGEPLNTQADRDAATTAGHYNGQNPYANRDPRFSTDIISNQSPCQGWTAGKAQIYYTISSGKTTYSELLNPTYQVTKTGYYERKRWANNSSKNMLNTYYTDPLFRLAELYLNYAEAANEAYGPNTPAPGASLTAVQAINIVRARVTQVPVLDRYTVNTDAFRPRIKNERIIELSWEGHYYHDIRRWKDAPAAYSSTLIGMDIEKLPAGYNATTYPIGFRHTRIELSANRQIAWKEPMYYLPFPSEDNFKMKKFVPNVVW